MHKTHLSFLTLITSTLLMIVCHSYAQTDPRPNILWITSEDNSPMLQCYGDDFARTPHLNQLASEGFLYTHAYANAPVCGPARNTIAAGMYASSGGHSNMRSEYPRGEQVRFHAEAMKALGYYCTNNSKTDYNTNVDREIWDECSDKAHFKHAPRGQPWFAVFNTLISHESQIHEQLPIEALTFDPKTVPIAPYHPRTEDMERDWAQYYQRIEQMDAFVGGILKQLDESGMAEDTIVFYYGDHGGVLARSKRFVYETSTRVPLIVRIPEKFKQFYPAEQPNSKVDRLISFVDLYPTLLSLVGASLPEQLQGEAFLGEKLRPAPQYAYMFRDRMDEWYDMSRAVRSETYRYIHNYMPHRIYGLPIAYLFRAKSLQSWKQAYEEGRCNEVQSAFWRSKPTEELYDTENDPWEIHNLAKDPAYADVLKELRAVNREFLIQIRDTGFMPEDERVIRAKDQSIYDYFQSDRVPIEAIIEAADIASDGNPANKPQLLQFLQSDDSAIRYWGATGLLILGEDARSEIPVLKTALNDSSESVAVVAAEMLYQLGLKEEAYGGFKRALLTDREFVQTHAMNAIYLLDDNSECMQKAVLDALKRMEVRTSKKYNYRAAINLLHLWELEEPVFE